MKRDSKPVYVLFASFFWGVFLLQVCFFSLILVHGTRALVKRHWPAWGPWLRMHWPTITFVLAMLISAIYPLFTVAGGFEYHWAIFGIWLLGASQVKRLNGVWIHRALMLGSLPGLIFSFYWLLRPAEISWAMEVGFHMYPRAAGFLGNPITHAEALVMAMCWSLARLHFGVAQAERRWIYLHIGVSCLILLASRVRAGVLVFTALFLLHGLISPRHRKLIGFFLLISVVLGILALWVFGFNTASIDERVDFWRHALEIWSGSPWIGIGPDRWELYPFPDRPDVPAHPHNTLLGILTEFGLLGVVTFVVFLGMLARKLLLLHRNSHEETPQWMVLALSYGFFCFLLFGLFDYNFHDTELLVIHSLHWCLIMGLPLGSQTTGSFRSLGTLLGLWDNTTQAERSNGQRQGQGT